jgi:dinuclear metal center YbgI/SA1388 family protein
MSCRIEEIIALLEQLAPPAFAEDWDNVGLQLGSAREEVTAVLLALDATREVLAEARAKEAGLLICHHPLIFHPLLRLVTDEPAGALVREALISGVAVYAAHTNLDASQYGVNTALAELLGLRDHHQLQRAGTRGGFKLVTFLPPQHVAAVTSALFRAGAGIIGDYSGCSFRAEGYGTFTPGPRSHPVYGKAGTANEVREFRLELSVGEDGLEAAVAALLESHPYEEPAYDVYPLRGVVGAGLGRVGDLPAPMGLGDLARRCSLELGNPAVRVSSGDPDLAVSRVAVCGGSGAKLAREALAAGAQVLITGDVGYHESQEAAAAGLAFIDAGHYHTEWPVLPYLASLLAERAEGKGLGVEILVSDVRTCPWINGGG